MEGITHSSALLHASPLVSLFDHNFHTEVCICHSHCPTPALSLTAQPFCGHQVQGVPEPWNQAAPWALLWPSPPSAHLVFPSSAHPCAPCSPVCFILFLSSWSFPFAQFRLSILILWVNWITGNLGHFMPTLIQPKHYNIPVNEY